MEVIIMVRYTFTIYALLACMLGLPTLALEPQAQCKTALEKLTDQQRAAIAGAMGTVNACIGTPFQHIKNALQNKEPRPPLKHWWRGTGLNILRSTPSTLPEVLIMGNADAIIKKANLPLTCDTQKAGLAFASAAPGTIVNVAAEQIVMRTKDGGTCYAIGKNIMNQSGPMGLFRGFTPKLLRDGTGSFAYWYAAPRLKHEYKKQGLHEPLATIAAGVSVALPSVIVTQPLDTISTAMQKDLSKTHYRNTLQSLAAYTRLHGWQHLFTGTTPRLLSAATRIPALITTQEHLTKYFRKHTNP